MKRTRITPELIASSWTTEQDCFLIENSALSIEELILHLPFSEEEIRVRKSVLGLVRRQRQMTRM
ncbi:hypothetical protein MMP61_02125 [Acinetobacter sp. NIPH 1958]|uniref:hypothetical protein n=1 Tax=unclassified Acinetobacter TaxID=196816 RepID=UPI0009D72BB7|nr:MULTISPECIES: hypothetical protein [unclassified Acinetobacter]MCH7353810.1 hypothetical protein [Acinetobacter sp. NIPH 2023]MCH7354383.1 hypothetical protein [Acinetobacter sp. NIPH 1958]MCH7361139.1 hypothetical protein [Acinetobacter sp. NIPH 2024]